MAEHAAAQVSDDDLKRQLIVLSDPDEHVERMREIERLGATVVGLMNVSGADPHAAIAVYGERVLPRLRA
jgi:coenzyme F420-dependent glucose-6-phosphate dehydrogenase